MRILVTAGATREPIDAVRYISNLSTGATGIALARALKATGHAVTVLRGKGGVAAKDVDETESFSSAADLRARLEKRLSAGTFGAVVMAAAVSDFRPDSMTAGKISSSVAGLKLNLVRNEKILPRIRSMSPRPLIVVGFKLTVGADAPARLKAVAAQFAAGGVDAVVHNDLEEIRAAFGHPFRLFTNPERDVAAIAGTEALAEALHSFITAGQRQQQQ